MRRVTVIVLLSIATVAAADKDKNHFAPGPASSYAAHQTLDKITIAAVPFITEAETSTAFGKLNPNKHGILPVLVILENGTGKALLSHTRLNDTLTLRLSIGNIRTTEKHVREVWELLNEQLELLK